MMTFFGLIQIWLSLIHGIAGIKFWIVLPVYLILSASFLGMGLLISTAMILLLGFLIRLALHRIPHPLKGG